jgi:cytochrome b pre-mRNA-processing protein 3
MFDRLLRRGRSGADIATRLYGAIVAQARRPVFYESLGVADTVTGRFEMVVLHLSMVVDRLQRDEGERALAQSVFDLYCVDMDRSLRELGIGDLGVPHRMKKMTEAFYGRARAYRDALANPDRAALVAAVERNVFGGAGPDAAAVADYMLASVATLAGTAVADLPSPSAFADPAAFVAPDGAAAPVP